MSYVGRIDGTLAQSGDSVSVDCLSHTFSRLTVSGTFAGSIVVEAIKDGVTVGAGQIVCRAPHTLPYSNTISDAGEFSLRRAGDTLRITAVEWISGVAELSVFADNQDSFSKASIDSIEEATRSKRAFVGGLAPVSVSNGSAAHVVIDNPSGSGVDLFLYNRKFSNDNDQNDAHIIYQAYVNPTVDTSSWDAASPPNQFLGGPASNIEIRTIVGPSEVMGGIQATGEILPNGSEYDRRLLTIIPAGNSAGFTIEGAGGGGSASQVSIIFEFYEERA